MSGAKVDDIGPLRDLSQLQVLYLKGTQVSDLSPLRDLTQLREIWLYGTPVSDLTPLVKMKGVTIRLYEGHQVTVPEELKYRVVRVPSP